MLNNIKNIIQWFAGVLIFVIFFYLSVIRVRLGKDLRVFYLMEEKLINNCFVGIILLIISLILPLLRLFFLSKEYYYPFESVHLLKYIIDRLNPTKSFFKNCLYMFYMIINDEIISVILKQMIVIPFMKNYVSIFSTITMLLINNILLFEALPCTLLLFSIFD